MRLRFYRFMESIFLSYAEYFGNLADEIDYELHQILREAMKDVQTRVLSEDAKK